MTRRPRRNHTAAFKSKVAPCQLFAGEQTLVELSQQFDDAREEPLRLANSPMVQANKKAAMRLLF